MLILAFDTATDVAASALVDDGEVLGERSSRAVTLLQDIDALLRQAGAHPSDIERLVVGIGPGSFTGTRIGLATARGLAVARDLPTAGVSTLAALAAGADGSAPVIDARRGEVYIAGPLVARPEMLPFEPGTTCVGDGALRYRDVLESGRLVVPPAGDERHQVRARFHALLATEFASADELLPLYVRDPDAEQMRA